MAEKEPGCDYAVTHRRLGPTYGGHWSTDELEPPPSPDGRGWFLHETNVAHVDGWLVIVATWQRFH